MRWLKLLFPWFYVLQLERELNTERMRLAGCGVAAMQNTRDSIKGRITKNNPFWSASYDDVCRSVDREILYRELLEKECGDIDKVIGRLGWNPEDFRTAGGCLHVPKLMNALADITTPGSGG